MAARGTRPGLPAGVGAVRRRIERWRETRERRTAMPEELWAAAASLAAEHGVWAISRDLGVKYESLRSRVERGQAGEIRRGGGMAQFVELDAGQVIGPGESGGTVVELTAADGARLTVRLERSEAVDILSLAAAFWGRKR